MSRPAEPATRHEALPSVIRTIIDIEASPERVFEALTDPRELAEWWGGDDGQVRECESDARPGGAWEIRTVDETGAERITGGEYLVVDPPRRLEHTWHSTGDDGISHVRYDLEPIGIGVDTGTRLTVTHTSPTAVASASASSWTAAMLALRRLVSLFDRNGVVHVHDLPPVRHRAVEPRRAFVRHLLAVADGPHRLPRHADQR